MFRRFTVSVPHSTGMLALLALLAALLVVAPGALAQGWDDDYEGEQDPEVIEQIQAEDAELDKVHGALEIPLDDKRRDLVALKNDRGLSYVRGTYFRDFKKIDDETYEAIFNKATATEESLTAERFRVTLKKDPSGKDSWSIAEEKLEGTFEGLMFRSMPGNETFHRFDSMAFEREGIKISGGKGSVVVYYWRGKPSYMEVISDKMRYDYSPPQDLGYHEVASVLRKMSNYEEGVWFKPSRFEFGCDGESCEQILSSTFKGLRDATLDGMHDKLQGIYKHDLGENKDAIRDNYMLAGFRRAPRDGHRWWNVHVKRQGSDHWARLYYNNEAPKEVTFSVTRMGSSASYGIPLFQYYSEATRAAGIDPLELEHRLDTNAQDYDLVSLTGAVELAVDDPTTMECDLTYVLRIRRPLNVLGFGIFQIRDPGEERSDAKDPSLRVHTMEDGSGEVLTYFRTRGAAGLILLPEEAKAGDELTIHVKFENRNSIYKLNPSYSYVDRGGWLPFVRVGDLIDEFSLEVTVPKRYEVLGIGHRVSETTEGDLRVARYAADNPVWFPTVIFGDYKSAESTVEAKKTDGTKIPVNIYVDKVSTQSYGQWDSREEAMGELQSGISEIRLDSLRPLANQAANSLNLYREIYGIDYPFGKLDLVNDPVGPGFYGQAPTSIIYLGTGVFKATGAVAHGGGTNISKFKGSVVAHEVAHQWWGGVVAHANRRHYWFVESLAEYSSALFIENLYASKKGPEAGRKAYLEHVEDWRRNVLEADLMAGVQDADTMWSGEIPGMARTAAIYNQGPYAFHVLRESFGDELFFPFLKRLAQELAHQEVTTLDIQRIAEESYQRPMGWFFDQWIRGAGLPEFTVDYGWRRAEDGSYIVQGTIKQRVVMGAQKIAVPGKAYMGITTVTAIGKDGKDYTVRVPIRGEETPFAFKIPVEPRELEVNETGGMLTVDGEINELS